MLSDEQREAERPEKEAREALVSYCAEAIREAAIAEHRAQIVDIIYQSLMQQFFGFVRDKFAGEVMVDIFKATLIELDKKK